jgi:CheY-like chemotaxis protein
VVEDNAYSAESLRRLLGLLSYEVQVVGDGRQAVAVALDWRPDFILLDVGLLGMDGYQVATRLRHESTCQETIIIAVTGYGQPEDRKQSRAVGIDHHLLKPVELGELLSLLSQPERRSDREGFSPPVGVEIGRRPLDDAPITELAAGSADERRGDGPPDEGLSPMPNATDRLAPTPSLVPRQA